MLFPAGLLAVAAVIGFSSGSLIAGEPPRFPLIWQSRSTPNANQVEVTRIYDQEAGVNCYVATVPWRGLSTESERPSPSISCVKGALK